MTISFDINATKGSEAMIKAGILGRAEVTVLSDATPIVLLKNILVRQGSKGPYVVLPAEKDKNGKKDEKGFDIYYPHYKLFPEDFASSKLLQQNILKKLGLPQDTQAAQPTITTVASKPKTVLGKAPVPATAPKADDLPDIKW